MPAVTVDNLSKRFGDQTALEDVSLSVDADELLVVLGPTGAGKTTLLRTIAGLDSPDAGSIRFGDADATALPPAQRDVALVFQNFSLYPSWSVRKNMAFPLKAPGRKLPKQEIAERIDWAADMLHIRHLLDRPASRLSGGEMQRVAIGRAIVRRPRVFLMDEPLTNLDAKLREALRVELVELRRRLRTPMIFVTHDQAEALSMGDRIVVLHEGRVLQTGTPQDVYRAPASPIVARQLGQPAINILAVVARNGHWQVGDLTLGPSDQPDGEHRQIGIRPEAIRPHGGDIPATIEVVEHMGPATILLVRALGHHLHILTARQAYQPQDELQLSIDHSRSSVWPTA